MQHWWIFFISGRAEEEKCAGPYFCEKGKILTCFKRKFSLTNFILSKNFLTNSKNMMSLNLSININRCISMTIKFYFKSFGFRLFDKFLNFATNMVFQSLFKWPYCTLHISRFRYYIKSLACLEDWESWNKRSWLLFFQFINKVLYFLVKLYTLPDSDF